MDIAAPAPGPVRGRVAPPPPVRVGAGTTERGDLGLCTSPNDSSRTLGTHIILELQPSMLPRQISHHQSNTMHYVTNDSHFYCQPATSGQSPPHHPQHLASQQPPYPPHEGEGPVEEFLQGECEAQRVVGPLPTTVLPLLHFSRFGVIPKSTPGKWRLILDLSSPRGASVYGGISPDQCHWQLASVGDAIQVILELGPGALLAKLDIKHAYRNVPVHPMVARHAVARPLLCGHSAPVWITVGS